MKSAVMNPGDKLFQLEIVEPRKREHSRTLLYDSGFVRTSNGRKTKLDDVPAPAPTRTLLKYFKDKTAAEKWGSRFGSVIACFKVDMSGYLENIEHLNLTQEPMSISLSNEGFTINKDLQVSRSQDTDFNIKVIDKGSK